jgi:cell division protease FtsH
MSQGKPTPPYRSKNFIILLVMILLLFIMFPLAGKDDNTDITRTEFLAMMGDSTKVITELTLQKTPDGVIIEGKREIKDINMEFRAHYESGDDGPTRNSCDYQR